MIEIKQKTGFERTPTRRKTSRREQQRSIDTRTAILDAALDEFAERGFDGASTRRIGVRAGLDHTLITYHYRTKDALWKAVAEYNFTQIQDLWEQAIPADSNMSAADRIRVEFRTFLRFAVEHSAFHHFMLRENQGNSPRLTWLLDRMLRGIKDRLTDQIRAAQEEGTVIGGDPDLVYYLLIGMTSALSSLKHEIAATTGITLSDEAAVESYWNLIEGSVFR